MLGNMGKFTQNLQISMLMGTGNACRYINITELHEKLGDELCTALPGFHALTGCDFNPSFFKKEKKKTLEIMRKSAKFIRTLIDICDWSNEDLDEPFKVLEEFVCRIYGYNNLDDINLIRVAQFMKTYRIKRNEDILRVGNNFDGSALPPCRSELRQHLLRTTYIARMWSHAHHDNPVISSPIEYGWREEDNKYYFQWFEGDQLPSIQTITDGIDQEENIIENLNETETQENEDDLEYAESALDDSSSDTSLEASDCETEYDEDA